MNKLIFFFIILCFFFRSEILMAELSDEDKATNNLKSGLALMDNLSEVGSPNEPCVAEIESETNLPGLAEGFFENGADCTDFIDKKGKRGELGNIIRNYIRIHPDKKVYLGEELEGMGPPQNICPNWPNLSVPEKEQFWIWTFAAISWKESTCNPKARNGNATNGVAVGLLQLDERSKIALGEALIVNRNQLRKHPTMLSVA